MSRRPGLVTGIVGVAATGLLAAGLAAEKLAVTRLRRELDTEPGVVYGQVSGTPTTVRTEDGLELYAEVDAGPVDAASGGAATYPFTTVFVHGYALSHDSWHFQRAALRLRGPVVSYDQRSHGRSERAPADSCTIAACGSDLARVIEQLVPTGKVLLVGHSMGGMSIMNLAARDPAMFADRVAGVVLAATSSAGVPTIDFGLHGPVARFAGRLTPALVAAAVRVPMLVERSRKADNDLSLLIARRYSFASVVPGDRVQFVAQMLAHTPIEVVADFYPTFGTHDGRPGLAAMSHTPVQVIGATQDRITPVEDARAIAAALPGAGYAELDPSGHLLMIEHPRRVTESVLALADRAAAAVGTDA
jgi:pimeloyl-ACP methyl ester carboxylesterase